MILYYALPHKHINGTLFYGFEYYAFLISIGQQSEFLLYNTDENMLYKIKKIFENKYEIPISIKDRVLKNIKSVKLNDLYKKTLNKNVIILDYNTYDKLVFSQRLIKPANIFLYANSNNKIRREKNLKIYGYYDYQDFDIREKLQFFFKIFKKLEPTTVKKNSNAIKNTKKSVFVNTNTINISYSELENFIKDNYICKSLFKYLFKQSKSFEFNFLFKDYFHHMENMYEKIDIFIYYHLPDVLEKNNRMIIESFYYGKCVIMIDNGYKNDSAYLRYLDIIENGISAIRGYELTQNNKLIQDFLECERQERYVY